ncbi:SnoaL-like protein [Flavobacterium sp. 1]|uniref:nuclear transport factor 2 family protein n=1 Tax=Flavobacterium sp. 1 TaxID=2035200 RepID=UPI000C232ABF|nr:nuclear transport factor 2 family protein [Flavobacterium sp. 1]PJJ08612.1 SnoaL-like protein [Flavobacterium sp. 1]
MKITGNLDADKQQEIANLLLSLVEGALARWYKGDPYGYLELYDQDNYSYFDPSKTARLDGFNNIKAFYDTIKGVIYSTDYSIVDPSVQIFDNTAVFCCNIIAHVGSDINKWNSTEVFRLTSENNWKILHSHWAFMRPMDIVFDPEKEIV